MRTRHLMEDTKVNQESSLKLHERSYIFILKKTKIPPDVNKIFVRFDKEIIKKVTEDIIFYLRHLHITPHALFRIAKNKIKNDTPLKYMVREALKNAYDSYIDRYFVWNQESNRFNECSDKLSLQLEFQLIIKIKNDVLCIDIKDRGVGIPKIASGKDKALYDSKGITDKSTKYNRNYYGGKNLKRKYYFGGEQRGITTSANEAYKGNVSLFLKNRKREKDLKYSGARYRMQIKRTIDQSSLLSLQCDSTKIVRVIQEEITRLGERWWRPGSKEKSNCIRVALENANKKVSSLPESTTSAYRNNTLLFYKSNSSSVFDCLAKSFSLHFQGSQPPLAVINVANGVNQRPKKRNK